ncbi:YCF48-related protein [Pseudoalteromonas sp. CnMc7-15]|uniref:WD40/YVTN/BNR-like repeat-containing protein n=1 Tax=unclassified Pseudoalteromonas TaxID=194690 RepID=UPI001EF4331B|nr:YCF48-related protein [Pseudoalteromonas sp. CnMc7-15]MCG7564822.1 YCF48-related protein [Pseudoalteromonas sp. CnMc7-15]
MKYLLWAVLLLPLGVSAQQETPQPAYQADSATRTLFTDITTTESRVIAVGQHGTIVYSDDGEQWQQATTPIDTLLTAVFFIDNQQGWACGHDASILGTTDGGASWQLLQYRPDLDKPCLDIHFFDKQNGVAVGAYGMYFETKDGGQNWTKRFLDSLLYPEDRDYLNDLKVNDPEGYEIETSSILPHFNRIAETSKGLYIAGEMGLIAHSTSQGQSWQREQEIYHGSFFDIAEVEGEILVAGLRGNAFKQGDSGQWQALRTQEQATMNSIVESNKGGVYIFGNSAVIYRLENMQQNQLKARQRADGKAVMDGAEFAGKLILATEAGIQTKELN